MSREKKRCDHIRGDKTPCKSWAIPGLGQCFWHLNREGRKKYAKQKEQKENKRKKNKQEKQLQQVNNDRKRIKKRTKPWKKEQSHQGGEPGTMIFGKGYLNQGSGYLIEGHRYHFHQRGFLDEEEIAMFEGKKIKDLTNDIMMVDILIKRQLAHQASFDWALLNGLIDEKGRILTEEAVIDNLEGVTFLDPDNHSGDGLQDTDKDLNLVARNTKKTFKAKSFITELARLWKIKTELMNANIEISKVIQAEKEGTMPFQYVVQSPSADHPVYGLSPGDPDYERYIKELEDNAATGEKEDN